jgi:hypothetical protein
VNVFTAKNLVFLDGGPQGMSGSGLPDGFYYVKVTEPNGTLLGASGAASIHVTGGEFDQCYNLFALTNFADTTNNGFEYKVWVSMDPSFPNSASKTDNFKVIGETTKLVPTVVTEVIDNGSGEDITNQTITLQEGETFTVHDVATVTGEGPQPTGDVTFDFFSNGVCNPEDDGTLTTQTVPLAGGSATSSDSADLPIDPAVLEYSYQATYNGDEEYLPGLAECEPFFITIVSPAPPVTPVTPEVEAATATVEPGPATLAFTGGGRTWMIPIGLALLLGGAALLVVYGRREQERPGLGA